MVRSSSPAIFKNMIKHNFSVISKIKPAWRKHTGDYLFIHSRKVNSAPAKRPEQEGTVTPGRRPPQKHQVRAQEAREQNNGEKDNGADLGHHELCRNSSTSGNLAGTNIILFLIHDLSH